MKYATYCVYLFLLIVLVALLGACRMVAAPATVAGESPAAAAATTDTETDSPGGETSSPSPELTLETIAGLWLQEHAGIYLELNADGTYKAWAGLPQPGGFPKEAGGLELSGNQLTFRSSDDGLMCRNQSGTYEVVAWSSDELEFALVTDECEGRKGNPNGAWEHVAETDE